jgi:large subunit ribosomal protein L23
MAKTKNTAGSKKKGRSFRTRGLTKSALKNSSAAKSKTSAPTVRFSDYSVLFAPIITEKSTLIADAIGGQRIAFHVDPRASKTEIRQAVESVFKVKVAAVRTLNQMGKPKRTTKSLGRRARTKKAYVTLAEGHKIELVEGV